jgi:hypothetical protein
MGGFAITRANHLKREDYTQDMWFYYIDASHPYVKQYVETNFASLFSYKPHQDQVLEIKILHEFDDLICDVGVFPLDLAEELYGSSRYNTHPMIEMNRITTKLCIDQLYRRGVYEVLVCSTDTNDLPPHLFVFKVVEMMKMCAMQPLAEDLIRYVGM